MNSVNIITTLYATPEFNVLNTTASRIDFLTHYFLGLPYLNHPQGEGNGFDSAPLYRFDGFDCVTYVNNIIALAISHDFRSFKDNLLKINYYEATPTFDKRFHFMSVDWNPQNQKNNIVHDATFEILDENDHAIALLAEGEIDRPGFFLKKVENDNSEHASYLHKIAMHAKAEYARVPYLPLNKLFNDNGDPAHYLCDQIPHASIIEIVRPNWQLKDKIGTNLHVSHVGFAIRQLSGELHFRHASSEQKCVVEVSLSEYLKKYLDSETVKGINVQALCNK